jgi:8-oxo-dGTP pyrophosphatase MutT (NUDIX family)
MAKVLAAGIFLVNKEKQVLICHPTNHPADVWSIPKGKIEDGEEALDAAIRETQEEANIDLSKGDTFIHLDIQTYSHKKKSLEAFLFLETHNTKVDFESFELKCNSNVPKARGGFPEMDDYAWVDIEIARDLLHPTQVASLDKIEELIEKTKDGLN